MRNSLKISNFFKKNETKAINISVLVEVLNSPKKNNYHSNFEKLIKDLCNLDIFYWLTFDDYKTAMDKFRFYNNSINFIYCTILISMKKYGISKIVTTDSSFSKIHGITSYKRVF